jgi:hypothetical protein
VEERRWRTATTMQLRPGNQRQVVVQSTRATLVAAQVKTAQLGLRA